MLVQIITTSCSRRDLELEQIRHFLVANGHELSQVDFETDKNADVIILSTCGFTQAAEDFGMKTLNRINNEKKEECEVIIGGCIPKINPEAVIGYKCFDPCSYDKLNDFFNADIPFSSLKRPNYLSNWSIHSSYKEHGMTDESDKKDFVAKATHEDNIKSVKTIATILRCDNKETFRIQCLVGCDCKCTYCAIKFAIGPIKSRPLNDIMEDVEFAIANGYKNLMLEGDSLGGYGHDINSNLGELLEMIYTRIVDTPLSISLPDISPAYLKICGRQIRNLVDSGKLYNLYLPLQSGSQKILNAMWRGYNISEVENEILSLKKDCPQLNIGTSIIVGFPGESDEDFNLTKSVCQRIGFDYVHVHSYSDRKYTESSTMENKVDAETILWRSRDLKQHISNVSPIITIAEDTKGNRSCQG